MAAKLSRSVGAKKKLELESYASKRGLSAGEDDSAGGVQ